MKFVAPALLLMTLALTLSGCIPGAGQQQTVKIDPVWSPDGKKVSFASNQDGNWEIYVVDLETKEVRRLTDTSANEVAPSWSPDGGRISFSSDRSGKWEIYTMKIDGTEVQQLTVTAAE